MTVDTEKVIDFYTKRISKDWDIIMRTPDGIQVKKIRRLSPLGFWIGLFLLPFWGIGVIFWLLAIFDYMWQFMAGDKIKFISVDQMIKQLKEVK